MSSSVFGGRATVGVADDPRGGKRDDDGNGTLHRGGNVEGRPHRLRDPYDNYRDCPGYAAGVYGLRGGAKLSTLSGC